MPRLYRIELPGTPEGVPTATPSPVDPASPSATARPPTPSPPRDKGFPKWINVGVIWVDKHYYLPAANGGDLPLGFIIESFKALVDANRKALQCVLYYRNDRGTRTVHVIKLREKGKVR